MLGLNIKLFFLAAMFQLVGLRYTQETVSLNQRTNFVPVPTTSSASWQENFLSGKDTNFFLFKDSCLSQRNFVQARQIDTLVQKTRSSSL